MRSCWNRWFERLGEKSCLKHWTHSSSYASLANVLAVEQRGSRVASAGAPGGWGVSKACRDCAGWRERLAEAQRSLSGALAGAKVWRYWHGKAKERAVWWQAQYEGKCAEPTARKLAEAEREVGKPLTPRSNAYCQANMSACRNFRCLELPGGRRRRHNASFRDSKP